VIDDDSYASTLMQAWSGKLEAEHLFKACSQLENSQLAPLSIILYQTWLKKTPPNNPYIDFFNVGAALFNLGEHLSSESAFRLALDILPGFIQARLQLGMVLELLGKDDQAIEQWLWLEKNIPVEKAEFRDLLILALNNLGRIYQKKKLLQDAVIYLVKSLELNPNQWEVLHHCIFLKEKICSWPIYDRIGSVTTEFMQLSTSTLATIALTDDLSKQLASAQRYANIVIRKDIKPLERSSKLKHKKIRIAYLSSDFCLHPVSLLTVQLYELHNRELFEVYGYCWSPEDGSELRQRIINAMDHFYRINQMDDESAAKLIHEHEIDILIDLQGQTSGARPNILTYRPATIQITYLGLPATTGIPSIDYVIADRYLIPEDAAPYYTEKPLYMPNVYQVSDNKRITGITPSRESCNLPEHKFVYCSFNNSYKLTEDMFNIWMNILHRTENSILWLLADNQWAQENLQKRAYELGINPDRLIFASRVAPENYLARFAIADLFLDSFPFNAGTTANDALWMGLPILTLSGRSFASRMAGSLLTTANLPELITHHIQEYEDKAVYLYNNPSECNRIRDHLENTRNSSDLFNTPKFIKNLEYKFFQLLDSN
jgi:predicted O-linked N-acetylglucosamine transferase (SPINDLY family)